MIKQMIEEAQQIQRQVNEDCQQLGLAREQQKTANDAYRQAKRAHRRAERQMEEAETSFLYRLDTSGLITGSNAEKRKYQTEARLIEERWSGSLCAERVVLDDAETALLNAELTLSNADLALEQCKDWASATTTMANLHAAILMALSGVKEQL